MNESRPILWIPSSKTKQYYKPAKKRRRVSNIAQKRNKELRFCFKNKKSAQERLQFETVLQNRKRAQTLFSAARTGYVMWLPLDYGWLESLTFVFLQVILSMFLWQCSLSLLEISTRSIWCVHFSFNLSGNCLFRLRAILFCHDGIFRSIGSLLKDHSDGNEEIRHLHI